MPVHKTMRITGGTLVRRRFLIPELVDENLVRPTPDRVREALFAILAPELKGAVILDLFAGSGAHGFEALSRGAKKVVFVEKDPRTARVIEENIKSLGLLSACELMIADVLKLITAPKKINADIVFVDPPYSLVLDADFFTHLADVCADAHTVIFRCFKKEVLNISAEWEIAREKLFAGTRVLILRRALT
jgi:16S rRNA (guanine966-N2)-methyltransferase